MAATLFQSWLATARRDPDARAVVSHADGRTLTRLELSAAATAWTRTIPKRAVFARRRVAISEPNGIEWWTAFLGLLSLDAVPVLIDSTETRENQVEIARAAGATQLWAENRWIRLGCDAVAVPAEALIKITSGSTGRPSLWPFSHDQMLADGRQICATMGVRADDLNLCALPLGHSYALGNVVVPLLFLGTAVVLVDSPLPNVLASATEKWGATVFPTVPAVLRALARSTVEPAALRSLRLIITAGAVMPAELATNVYDRFGLKVHNFYGSTETGGICYDRTGEATLTGRSVGAPLQGVQLHLQADGRFQVESAAVGGQGSFSPVDFGRLTPDGELVLTGRAGRVVKLGARRVDLGEIEVVLKSLPPVRDAYAAVIATGRTQLVALVATDATTDEIRQALATKLPVWKQPRRLLTVRALPSTGRGKLDRPAAEALLFGAAAKPLRQS